MADLTRVPRRSAYHIANLITFDGLGRCDETRIHDAGAFRLFLAELI
jgi:hypothetical protein